jgi:hypothetical protein
MKTYAFFLKYMGKIVGAGAEIFDKVEPGAKFLKSWSRTKMDRLRNTVANKADSEVFFLYMNQTVQKTKSCN